MKNILLIPLTITVILLLLYHEPFAQCEAQITGNSCVGNLITTHVNGSDAKEILWFRNGAPSMLRTNYASYGEPVTEGLDIPSAVTFDKDGNMYVTEYRLNAVVKFPKGADTGFIVAGGNGKGSDLNQLNGPEDVQVDRHGNIFIADVYNYRIVKWARDATTGKVVAGGNGAGSDLDQFNWPNSLSLDTAGNIYVADVYNNRIVKWAPGAKSGVIVAGGVSYGSGADQLYHPLGVFVDTPGNIYISDFLNYRVQKWAPGATRGITVAGGYGPGDGPERVIPEELFVDKDENIYVIDSYSQGVKRWAPGKKAGYTVAGGYGLDYTPYHLYFPRGVYVKSDGTVYVAVGGDGEPGHGQVKQYVKTEVADSNYYTSGKAANYKSMVFGKAGCRTLTDIFKVITTPQKPSPISGLFNVMEKQNAVSYSVIGKPGYTYQWTFPGDVSIISGQGTPVITVNWCDSSGFVSVAAVDACGVSDTRNAYVTVSTAAGFSSVASALSKGDVQSNHFSVYPNPAKDRITVSCKALTEERLTIRITDIAGKQLQQQYLSAAAGYNSAVLDISRLAPGVYHISIYGNRSGVFTSKIIKQ